MPPPRPAFCSRPRTGVPLGLVSTNCRRSKGADADIVSPFAIRRDSGVLFLASYNAEGTLIETSDDQGAHWETLAGSGLPASSIPNTLSALPERDSAPQHRSRQLSKRR